LEGEQGGISKAVNWQGGGDFIYCELAKYNETFMDLVQSATTTDELLKIWLEMKEKAFLDYRVETTNFETEEFKTLNLEEQKSLLVEVLDKNQLYVNYTEMGDLTYDISQEDKDLTNKFYNI
jgi:adenine-specific DNA-methyltransferase